MRDPGILDPRHFFFPRHFYTIYAIFTQFYAILHDFCAIFHDFCTILREFCDFYAIFCDFYAIFAIFTRFLRFLRDFLPGKNFSIPGTKNYYPGLGVTPNQRSLAKDHSFSGFCWHPSLIHCCSTPCDQDDKMPSDGRSWMEEGSDSAGICTVGINLIFQSHFHSWTCPWRNPVAWL